MVVELILLNKVQFIYYAFNKSKSLARACAAQIHDVYHSVLRYLHLNWPCCLSILGKHLFIFSIGLKYVIGVLCMIWKYIIINAVPACNCLYTLQICLDYCKRRHLTLAHNTVKTIMF